VLCSRLALLVQEVGSVDSERGQVLQTAEVVMSMLDKTMPGTLTEEKKKKVMLGIFWSMIFSS